MNVNTLKISAMLSVLRALPYSSGPPPWSASPGRRPLLRHLPGQYYGGGGQKLLPGLALKRPCFAARGANKPPTQEPAGNSGILDLVHLGKAFSPACLALRHSPNDSTQGLLVQASSVTSILSLRSTEEIYVREDVDVDEPEFSSSSDSFANLRSSLEDLPSSSPSSLLSCSIPGGDLVERAPNISHKASSLLSEDCHPSLAPPLSTSTSLVSASSSLSGISTLFHDESAFHSPEASVPSNASLFSLRAASTSNSHLVDEIPEPVQDMLESFSPPRWAVATRLLAMLHEEAGPNQECSQTSVADLQDYSGGLNDSLAAIVPYNFTRSAVSASNSVEEHNPWDSQEDPPWLPPPEEKLEGWDPSKSQPKWDDYEEEAAAEESPEDSDVLEIYKSIPEAEEEEATGITESIPRLVLTPADVEGDENVENVESDEVGEAFNDVVVARSCARIVPFCEPESTLKWSSPRSKHSSRKSIKRVPSSLFGKENGHARAQKVKGKRSIKSSRTEATPAAIVDNLFFHGSETQLDDSPTYDVLCQKLGEPTKLRAGRRRPARPPLRSMTEKYGLTPRSAESSAFVSMPSVAPKPSTRAHSPTEKRPSGLALAPLWLRKTPTVDVIEDGLATRKVLESSATGPQTLDAFGLPPPQLNLVPVQDLVRQALPSLPSFKLSDWSLPSKKDEAAGPRVQDLHFLSPMSALDGTLHKDDDEDASPSTVQQANQYLQSSTPPSFFLSDEVYSASSTSVDKLSAQLGRLSTISPSERVAGVNDGSPLQAYNTHKISEHQHSLQASELSSSDVGVTERSSASA
ncbi:hypothetical protein NEOLEDRAFT_1243223 [Neolentinus lepideus HHB14362 ss-1]|uniref:Uncharacterized protein n=1 Tax=Neolentinus lepideus HHB14362 ss-1 TaxID=1314782 RepID=A0A165R811_9AGAM|nr:hypothetical protein NEOLEDRAFT_1243223 [Neolentinus lepideus HHB14362 ss-1]